MCKKTQAFYLFIYGNREPTYGRIISHLSVYHGVSYHPKEMKIRTNPECKSSQRERILHYDTLIIP